MLKLKFYKRLPTGNSNATSDAGETDRHLMSYVVLLLFSFLGQEHAQPWLHFLTWQHIQNQMVFPGRSTTCTHWKMANDVPLTATLFTLRHQLQILSEYSDHISYKIGLLGEFSQTTQLSYKHTCRSCKL